MFILKNTHFDSYRVLISNVRNVMDAQFDSHTRATGHSYTKYNNWEKVWGAPESDTFSGAWRLN